jgi:hypothetical protein
MGRNFSGAYPTPPNTSCKVKDGLDTALHKEMTDEYCYRYANDRQGAQIKPNFAKGHVPLADRHVLPPSTDKTATAQSTLQSSAIVVSKTNSGKGVSCPRLDRMAQRRGASM